MKPTKNNRFDVFAPAFPMKTCLTFILFLCAPVAHSGETLYKCVDVNGTVLYTTVDNSSKSDKTVCNALDLPKPGTARAKPRASVSIGMSKEAVFRTWGRPKSKVTRTQTRNGVIEKMTYPNGVLTFVNGSLEMIQN